MLVVTRKKVMRRELMILAAIVSFSVGAVVIAIFAHGWSEVFPYDYQYIQSISEDRRTSQITYNLILDCLADNKITSWEYDSIHESFMNDKRYDLEKSVESKVQSRF